MIREIVDSVDVFFVLFCYNLILIKFYLANEEEKEEKKKAFTQRSSW